jgi:hypothetical protein
MRANSSFSSLVVVVLALVGGCSPAEDPSVVVAPPGLPAPDPAPAPTQATVDDLLREVEPVLIGQSQGPTNELRPSNQSGGPFQAGSATPADFPSPPVRRLYFQCTDDVSFAVRSVGSRLEVYPPGHSHGYIVLTQQPSDSGLYYTARGAELRMNRDLATLHVGRDRYVDCVSNPAAAVWEDPRRGGTPTR